MPSESRVDEDVVCKRCEARSRAGYPVPTGPAFDVVHKQLEAVREVTV